MNEVLRTHLSTGKFLMFASTTAIVYQTLEAPGNFSHICNNSWVRKRQKLTSIAPEAVGGMCNPGQRMLAYKYSSTQSTVLLNSKVVWLVTFCQLKKSKCVGYTLPLTASGTMCIYIEIPPHRQLTPFFASSHIAPSRL